MEQSHASHLKVVYRRPAPGPVARLNLANRFGTRAPRDWVVMALTKSLFLASVLYFIWG